MTKSLEKVKESTAGAEVETTMLKYLDQCLSIPIVCSSELNNAQAIL